MKATITSKGQITIPVAIREKLGLKPGDQIEFDENATILVGRRVIDSTQWQATLNAWRNGSREALSGHPWDNASAMEVLDDLRGGPAEAEAP